MTQYFNQILKTIRSLQSMNKNIITKHKLILL